MQGVVPSENSLISLMLRAKTKETGRGLTDKEVAAQVNTFMAAGMGLQVVVCKPIEPMPARQLICCVILAQRCTELSTVHYHPLIFCHVGQPSAFAGLILRRYIYCRRGQVLRNWSLTGSLRQLFRVNVSNVSGVSSAGHDSTSMALTFAVALLARHPGAEQKLVAEMDALRSRCHAVRRSAVVPGEGWPPYCLQFLRLPCMQL